MDGLEVIDSLTATLMGDNQILIECSLIDGDYDIDNQLFFVLIDTNDADDAEDEMYSVLLRLYNEAGSSIVQFEQMTY